MLVLFWLTYAGFFDFASLLDVKHLGDRARLNGIKGLADIHSNHV
jgi:hypothetical protein